MTYCFGDMERWGVGQLRKVRKELRDKLADEIHKRDAIKAEILYLQKEIAKYQDSDLEL